MKDRFKVVFGFKGWTIKYSRLGLFWRECGGYTYQSKAFAEKLCADLLNGTAPNSWYSKSKSTDEDSSEAPHA